eukprot:3876692-Prymnesium_polylepis.1
MQEELTALKPQLLNLKKEAEEMQVAVDKEVQEVIEPKQEKVAEEEKAMSAVAMKAKGMKDECEACSVKVLVAMVALNSAVAALDTIRKQDIDLIKGMNNPPATVRLILECVCVMMEVKPEKVKDPAGGNAEVDDFFGPAKKMMGDVKVFVGSLK